MARTRLPFDRCICCLLLHQCGTRLCKAYVKIQAPWYVKIQAPGNLVGILPTWKGSAAVQRRVGACGLWATPCQEGETSLHTVKRLQSAFTRDPTAEPIFTQVSQQGAVELWRRDIPEAAIQCETQASASNVVGFWSLV